MTAPASHTTHHKPGGLLALLEALPHANAEARHQQIRDCVAKWREQRIKAARTRFEKEGQAVRLLAELTLVMDETIAALYRLLVPGSHGIAVVATGGYGRKEMFPYSDVDLLFLYRPAARVVAERTARTMLYILWDVGLQVGHALRSIDDTLHMAEEDLTIRTNLLDARLVVGDAELLSQLQKRYQEEIVAGSTEKFIEQKLAERDERHRRFGDSRYLLEPNIKESKGGLRDLHTLYWITRYVYGVEGLKDLVKLGYLTTAEYRTFEKATLFLWEMRAHLHFLAGKAEERLTFDRQQALAPLMGYRARGGILAVERLMKRYFMTASSVGALTRIVCALLEDQRRRKPKIPLAMRLSNMWKLEGFSLDGDRLSVKGEAEFKRDPLRMLKLFHVAQAQGCDIHPRALQLVARNLRLIDRKVQEDAKANALFLEMLLSKRGCEQTLRRMNEVGLLGRFIPDFGRIVGQMQFNMYHIYTVDEHTIVALGVLHAIEQGLMREDMPLASDIIRHVQSRRALFLALFCHDVAKGQGDDHSGAGAKIVSRLAKRFGFSAQEAETTAWLVQNHLLFTSTAFKRDSNDPQTVRDFVDTVQTIERLRLLLCLTVADMRAVGPGIWNAWKATLLRNLYRKAETYIRTGELADAAPIDTLRAELQEQLSSAEQEQVEKYLNLGSPEYLAGLDAASHARVLRLLNQLETEQQPMLMDARHDTSRGISAVTVITPDQHALFSKLAGAISMAGANIVTAKIFTLKNGMAVDTFHLQSTEGKAFDQPERLARMSLRMRQAITGEIDVAKELSKQKLAYASRRDAFQVEGQVFIENDVSATHTVVEIVGRDRVGFLYAVTKVLSEAGLTIGSAHISTYGAQAVDVFYVKDIFGMKIMHEKKQQELRDALLAAVTPEQARPEKA